MNLDTWGKKISVLLVLGVFSALSIESHHANRLIRFRSTDMPYEWGKINYVPSDVGFKDLHISGSSRPNLNGLTFALSNINMPVYICDLFGEDHYYIQGRSESWYGYSRSKGPAQDKRTVKFHEKVRRYIYTGKLTHDDKDVMTPRELAESLGFNYLEVDQVRKGIPTPSQVDSFVKTIETLPENVWVHYHCSAGRGRTTVYMVMHDILKNGSRVSLKDIFLRHYLIGSEDLSDTTVWPNGHYTQEMLEERRSFIESFYKYVNDPKGKALCTWSQWLGYISEKE